MTLDIDEAKVRRNEAGLWLGWTLATAAGMLFGLLPFILFIDLMDIWMVRILVPLWAGFMVGLFQWLVLRGYLTHSVDWILHGGAGWALAYALGLIILQILDDSLLGVLVAYLLFGIIIGLVQWPVLRREIPSVLPWVAASVAGWALGAYLSPVVLDLFAGSSPINQVVSTAVISGVTGLVAGAVTGLALVWIVRQPDTVGSMRPQPAEPTDQPR